MQPRSIVEFTHNTDPRKYKWVWKKQIIGIYGRQKRVYKVPKSLRNLTEPRLIEDV